MGLRMLRWIITDTLWQPFLRILIKMFQPWVFIAHVDTSPDMPGLNVNPQIIENYDGKVIKLNDRVKLSPVEFPHLLKYKGQTLITTDGTTLLGADDKAGVAEIMTAAEYLMSHPELKAWKNPDRIYTG